MAIIYESQYRSLFVFAAPTLYLWDDGVLTEEKEVGKSVKGQLTELLYVDQLSVLVQHNLRLSCNDTVAPHMKWGSVVVKENKLGLVLAKANYLLDKINCLLCSVVTLKLYLYYVIFASTQDYQSVDQGFPKLEDLCMVDQLYQNFQSVGLVFTSYHQKEGEPPIASSLFQNVLHWYLQLVEKFVLDSHPHSLLKLPRDLRVALSVFAVLCVSLRKVTQGVNKGSYSSLCIELLVQILVLWHLTIIVVLVILKDIYTFSP